MGTVLSTFRCADPDSPASTLDYRLRFHGPSGLPSLCLSDRDLQVPRAWCRAHVQGRCLQREVARVCESRTRRVKEMVAEPARFAVWKHGARGVSRGGPGLGQPVWRRALQGPGWASLSSPPAGECHTGLRRPWGLLSAGSLHPGA